MLSHEKYMHRCLQLAKIGQSKVAPNPMVGTVIVLDEKIIGEGYHQEFGGAHAEVNAINSVEDKSLLAYATIYVSLEPCAHFGKTPPCANLIVEHRFKKVVIGSRDPYSEVDGKGIKILRENGIEVISGILENECNELNKRFFTFHQKIRPFVFLKWAETTNGLIDNGGNSGEVTWISCKETQSLVHLWRSENQAVLVGRRTVENDNPSLTVREVTGKNPVRVVIDSQLKLDNSLRIFDDNAPTIILNSLKNSQEGSNEFVKLKDLNPASILHELYVRNIQSVLIEGGTATLQSFIDKGLWDEAKKITGMHSFASGTKAPVINSKIIHTESFFNDEITTYINQ
ncbi:MAG: bifunctional diaminohydroxyphosphoribosylaminopyrimidine deaminase/5-amino-6-(5-phosphoribosylamino)uracil reductase RibD [Fluviicola sp.]|nr:bifunctional diaminohydroxyphosphoribosylaminopyrimidine deaminase/5-amino-6-(5-phosphoribosylamino)uracil reductase RibD [Fluviicola sp.]